MLIHDSDSKCQQIRFSLIVEQILAFASSPNMVREVKNRLQISNQLRYNLLHY